MSDAARDRPAFADWLQAEFLRKKKLNPAYTLRGFAKNLAVSPGLLSEILAGKRNVGPVLAQRFLRRLDASEQQRDRLLKPRGRVGAARYRRLDDDVFPLISDWYHFAILCLSETRDFRGDPKWIAARLGLSTVEVRAAVARLVRLKMLEKDGERLSQPADHITTGDGVPSEAIRNSHRQHLQKAAEAVDAVGLDRRDITTISISINSAKLASAKMMIRDFRRQLAAHLEDGERDQVYCLNVNLFPLTVEDPKHAVAQPPN